MWYMYTMEYYLAIKKQKNANRSNMDGHREDQTKWNNSNTNITWYHLYVESKKNDKNEPIYKTETDSDFENKLMVTKGKKWENKSGVWD